MKETTYEHPVHVTPLLRTAALVCPLCLGSLTASTNAYHCRGCQRDYALHDGIPDFRVFPDRYLDFQQDGERSNIVLEGLEQFELKGLLEYYWSFSDVTPQMLRERYIRSALLGERKAEYVLEKLTDGTFKEPLRAEKVLDIGSGTGNLLAVAAPRFNQVVGVDIAMRWLHVSRRRFMDKGIEMPPLVCCCAEHLPFPDAYFDLALLSAALEFTTDQERVLSECARILKQDGSLYVSTVNRFSITQDPYAYLWGVGFLPRSWQAPYVSWRRHATYKNIRLLSLPRLKRIAKRHFTTCEIALPDIDNESLHLFSPAKQFQVKMYRKLKKLPIVNNLLLWVAPQWDIKLGK